MAHPTTSKKVNYEAQKIAKEFVSMILSAKLAAEFNKEKPNTAIKATLKRVYKRLETSTAKAYCETGISSFYPLGWLAKIDNSIVNDGKYTKENFLKIGANL